MDLSGHFDQAESLAGVGGFGLRLCAVLYSNEALNHPIVLGRRRASIAAWGLPCAWVQWDNKTELVKHIHHHDPKLMSAIVAVETVDHPSDAQIVTYARKYLDVEDRMQPQKR